jgi:hypothetical protein
MKEHRFLSTPASRNEDWCHRPDYSSSLHRQKSGPRERVRPPIRGDNPHQTPAGSIYNDKLDPSALHFQALWPYERPRAPSQWPKSLAFLERVKIRDRGRNPCAMWRQMYQSFKYNNSFVQYFGVYDCNLCKLNAHFGRNYFPPGH